MTGCFDPRICTEECVKPAERCREACNEVDDEETGMEVRAEVKHRNLADMFRAWLARQEKRKENASMKEEKARKNKGSDVTT